MNYLLQRQGSTTVKTNLPEGLSDLMSDISREVLRVQPENDQTASFIADYLKAVLKAREHSLVLQRTLEEVIQVSLFICNAVESAGICQDKAIKASRIVREELDECVRDLENIVPKTLNVNTKDLIDHIAKECQLSDNEKDKIEAIIAIGIKEFYCAYTKIFKGYLGFKGKHLCKYSALELNEAATKIQAQFRGYKIRKNHDQMEKNMNKGVEDGKSTSEKKLLPEDQLSENQK